MTLTIREVTEAVGGRFVGDVAALETRITSVVRDNREATAGSLFLCFVGERVDGHDFAADAFARGAVCAICEQPLATQPLATQELSPSQGEGVAQGSYILVDSTAAALRTLGACYRGKITIPIVGVIGSVGKTTAKELISAALGARFNVLKTDKNLNNEIGVPLTLLSIGAEHDVAVVEMGISDFGEMTRLGEMARPNIVIFTTVGHSHLEQLGDLDGVLRAKSEVFATMANDGVAVVCGDDMRLLFAELPVRKITFGTQVHNDYRAEHVRANGTERMAFVVNTPTAQFTLSLDAYGSHLAAATAGAVAVAELLGVIPTEYVSGLMNYRAIDGRANVIRTQSAIIIDDCYNANPNSVAAALKSLAALETLQDVERRVAILGDMKELGAGSKELHRDIGILAGELGIDVLICVGEHAEFFLKGFVASKTENQAYHFPFKEAFFERLPMLIKKGDAILVKASHSMNFAEIVTQVQTLLP